MQTPYIYSTSRVNTLAQYLLTKTDVERLLVASPAELSEALKETYLAPFLLRVPEEDLASALELTLIEAKQLIHRIAPQGDHFRLLWVQYDLHNLRVFAKAEATSQSYEAIMSYLSERGIYAPTDLFAHVEAGTLDRLESGWQAAYTAATRAAAAGETSSIDGIFDAAYFSTVKRIAFVSQDAFLSRYLRAVIDGYNLTARLRLLSYPQLQLTPSFVSGGTFNAAEIETKEQVVAAFTRLSSVTQWEAALATYEETGHTTELDARLEEYLTGLAYHASGDMFSSASLVSYYLRCRQAAANVRTIMVGKHSGQPTAVIRRNLRLQYVND